MNNSTSQPVQEVELAIWSRLAWVGLGRCHYLRLSKSQKVLAANTQKSSKRKENILYVFALLSLLNVALAIVEHFVYIYAYARKGDLIKVASDGELTFSRVLIPRQRVE